MTGGNYAKFVEFKKSHDIEKCATSLDAGIQELGCAEGFGGMDRGDGVPLSDAQQTKTVNLILEWIKRQAKPCDIVTEYSC